MKFPPMRCPVHGEHGSVTARPGDVIRCFEDGCNQPMISAIAELPDIVRELAERGPFTNGHLADCAFCGLCAQDPTCDIYLLHRSAWMEDPANHEPSCLWRQSKALYPGAKSTSERWIVDLRDSGGYFVKTESGTVIREGLRQAQARQMANAHNGDQQYPGAPE